MMLLLIIFVLLLPFTETIDYSSYSVSMLVTYGKPNNFSAAVSFSVDNWDACVIQCYIRTSCVVAHSPGIPIDCKLYNVNKIFEVEKLTAANDMLVAFKVANSQDTCPTGSNPPTFGDGPSYGAATDNNLNYTYSITPTPGPSWTLSYNITPICQPGWTMFARPTTLWCIQVLGGPTTLYTQDQATAVCQAVNSVLTGLETKEERDFVANTGVALLGPDYPEFAGFWVSGFRKAECFADGWRNIPYCNGTNIQQFTFTDTHMTNYAGYTWDPNQPDRNTDGNWQNCIQVWIRNEIKFPDHNYTVIPNGNADDAKCGVVDYSGYHLRGFACGKVAQLPV